MGAVWRAEHLDLGTPAAVKLIDESFAQSPEALSRFRREAQAAASLRSANVVQILDYGIDGETPFIAMELLEGESLADRIDRLGRIEPMHCAAILHQVSKALSRAHDMDIVHRDLKPDNIFLVRDGDDEIAKVLDFGIAKRTGALQTSSDMATRTGSLMGTPYYMSPEQASGRRQVDRRTDIWAFAVIAYECMTGQRPFDDTNLGGLLLSICTENPAPASSILVLPSEFDTWFARCTAKDPAMRYETIREAAAELCCVLGVAMPTSRLAMQSQSDGTQPRSPLVVQSVTGPWAGSRSGNSAATPGAVIVPVSGDSVGTLARSINKRPPILLLATGTIGALGLASVVVALVWRSLSPGTDGASAAASASAESVRLSSAAAAAEAPPTVSVMPAAVPAPAPTEASVVPASSASAKPTENTSTKSRAPTPVVAPRKPVRQVSERPATPANTGRLRPQDRLERDLGF